ncbi:MAG: hypothetical protein H0U64_00425 [Gemmatimonadaceae bacterium]|nr:hypothetical protein [Gemmatimonadaceae bacterium]
MKLKSLNSRVKAGLIVLTAVGGGTTCSDFFPLAPAVVHSRQASIGDLSSKLPLVQAGDSAGADSLAFVFAALLADPGIRAQILTDLRDSPFSRHRLHLPSYLMGGRGQQVTIRAAQYLNIPTTAILGMARRRGGLQILMRRPMDRANWKGTDDIVVAATVRTVSERLVRGENLNGFAITGAKKIIPLLDPVQFPFLVIEPVTHGFGRDPEAARQNAPMQNRATISTPDLEVKDLYVAPVVATESPECSPWAIQECSVEQSGAMGVYLPSSFTMATCRPAGGTDPSSDRDQDGVVDQCEYEIANAFHPQLQFDSRDCNTGREPYWAANYKVSSIDNQPVIQVFYAISYYSDCGSPSLLCPAQCYGHFGDSEFIIAEVTPSNYPASDGVQWVLKRVTLSAHWNADGTDDGDVYSSTDLEYGIAAPYSNPLIWVALGKHANYRSKAVCDAGLVYYDTCDSPGARVGLDVLSTANVGQRGTSQQLIDQVGSRAGQPGTEWYWTENNPFLGWNPRSSGGDTTAYGRILRFFGF